MAVVGTSDISFKPLVLHWSSSLGETIVLVVTYVAGLITLFVSMVCSLPVTVVSGLSVLPFVTLVLD